MSRFARDLIAFTLANDVSRNWLLTVIEWIKLECDHKSEHCVADDMEGDCHTSLSRCRLCGSVKRGDGPWRL